MNIGTGDLPARSRFGRHGTTSLSAVALAKAGGFFQQTRILKGYSARITHTGETYSEMRTEPFHKRTSSIGPQLKTTKIPSQVIRTKARP